MLEYNLTDVDVMFSLYEELRPWIKNHPNVALWMEEGVKPKCPHCGSENMRFKGYKRTKVLGYKQYNCKDCGAWSRERQAADGFKKRKDVVTT